LLIVFAVILIAVETIGAAASCSVFTRFWALCMALEMIIAISP